MSPYRTAFSFPPSFIQWALSRLVAWWSDPWGRKAAKHYREEMERCRVMKRDMELAAIAELLAQIPNHYERERRTIQFEMIYRVTLPRPWEGAGS